MLTQNRAFLSSKEYSVSSPCRGWSHGHIHFKGVAFGVLFSSSTAVVVFEVVMDGKLLTTNIFYGICNIGFR